MNANDIELQKLLEEARESTEEHTNKRELEEALKYLSESISQLNNIKSLERQWLDNRNTAIEKLYKELHIPMIKIGEVAGMTRQMVFHICNSKEKRD
tara:strand:- start:610 stop:900 length:291 start_codon:yes stop_codon:yes gene_type:complete